MGRFCILNFTQFYQNRILSMKYCSGKDCNRTSFCENVILHTLKEQCIAIVKWKTDSHSRICSRHFENKCYRSLFGKKVMEQCCTHRFGCSYRFSCLSDKERPWYALPYSQETIQLQDSAEMGMKYRERCYNHQKRKKNLKKLWKISGQDTLKTTCQKYSIQESTMELLMASAYCNITSEL